VTPKGVLFKFEETPEGGTLNVLGVLFFGVLEAKSSRLNA
jgi:hypothetical protein